MIEVHAFATPEQRQGADCARRDGAGLRAETGTTSQGRAEGIGLRSALNPNGKVPVLVDDVNGERFVLTDSAAILVHLAEKTGKLLPADAAASGPASSSSCFFHASALSPAFGNARLLQALRRRSRSPVAEARFTGEAGRIVGSCGCEAGRSEPSASTGRRLRDRRHRSFRLAVASRNFPA